MGYCNEVTNISNFGHGNGEGYKPEPCRHGLNFANRWAMNLNILGMILVM